MVFKKGRNPTGGRPKLPDELKEVKNLKPSFVRKVFSKILQMKEFELERLLENPHASMLEKIAGKIVADAYEKGCHYKLNFLLDRIVGKVKDQVEPLVARPTIIERLDGRVIELNQEIIDVSITKNEDEDDDDD